MFATLIALAAAAYLLFAPGTFFATETALALIAVTTLIFTGCLAMLQGFSWWALQRAELKATPRTLELYKHRSHWSRVALYLVALGAIASPFLTLTWLIALWIILLGITIDSLHYTIIRVFLHLSPNSVVDLYSASAKRCIQQDKPAELCQWYDAITEAGLQAIRGQRPSLTLQILDDLQGSIRNFLQANKSISHNTLELQKQGGDTVVYVLLYVLQRIEFLSERAAEQRLEFICTGSVTTLGKMTIDAADYDLSIAQYPLMYLRRITRQAAKHDMPEVAAKASYTLVELSKQIKTKIDLTYLEIADFFGSVVSQLEENSKILFKNNKAIDVKALQQPFLDLKAMFNEEPLSKHRDAPTIRQDIDTALGQFTALEEIMQGLSPELATAEPLPDDEGLSAKIVQDLEERLGVRPAEEEPPKLKDEG